MTLRSKVKIKDTDRGWKKLRRELRKRPQATEVGIRGEQGARRDGDIDNVTLGVVHEFGATISTDTGTIVIPARSWLREPIDKESANYGKLIKRLMRRVVELKGTQKQVLELLGAKVQADLVRNINKGIDPALSPRTVAKKGSTKQLVDSGQLKGAITHKVVNA